MKLPAIKKIRSEFKDKQIVILGLGKEGTDSLKFLRELFPHKTLGLADQLNQRKLNPKIKSLIRSDSNLNLHLGKDYLKGLKNYQIVIQSPGIPPQIVTPRIGPAQELTSQTKIFLEHCAKRTIGITGTKGKSTTASLIYHLLKPEEREVHLVGNIGKPVLSAWLNSGLKDLFVYELSSHQLALVEKSPHIAIFLNIFPEHLDYYSSFKDYLKAKANICIFQEGKDYLIYNSKDENVKEIALESKAKKIPFDSLNIGNFIDQKDIPLKGDFNLQNIRAAISCAKLFDLSASAIAERIKKFKPLPHRLELVGKYQGIKFYNDALSTIPQTAIAAMEALGPKVTTIILGGFDRNINFSELAREILNQNIQTVILFPTTGKKIWEEIIRFASNGLPQSFFVDNMREAVKIAYQKTNQGEICLLSCASPSFSIFKNYRERGNLFKKYVKEFSHEKGK